LIQLADVVADAFPGEAGHVPDFLQRVTRAALNERVQEQLLGPLKALSRRVSGVAGSGEVFEERTRLLRSGHGRIHASSTQATNTATLP
jgi:hypothetical protein